MQTPTTPRNLSEREVHKSLRNLRRRYVLYYLLRRERPVRLDELVDQVAAWEANQPAEDVPSDWRKSVYSALRQTHLPTLESVGILRYDPETNVVELTDRAQTIRLHDASTRPSTVGWHRPFLALSALAIAVALLWGAGVHPLSTPGGLASTLGALVGLFALSSLGYSLDRYRNRDREARRPDFSLEFVDE